MLTLNHPVQLVPREDHAGKHSMTTTHPSPLVEAPCATYDLLTTLIL